MTRFLRYIKQRLGYLYPSYKVEYNSRTHRLICTPIPPHEDLSLRKLAVHMRLDYGELRDLLVDTCTCGGIYEHGNSIITLEVKRGSVCIINNIKQ